MSEQDTDDQLTAPEARTRLVGHDAAQARIADALRRGDLTNGWLIVGPDGVGKATLAFRIARALFDPDAGLASAPGSRVFSLVAQRAHPDLFIARRPFNEKTGRQSSDITVEVVRDLITFLSRTPALGGWRVAIIDTADDLNRNAANALLKVLEEPPSRTLLLLLSSAPGRLPATIRSRCRRLSLEPVKETDIAAFLHEEGVASVDEASAIARVAKGRPGRALRLATGEGADAVGLVEAFLEAAPTGEIAAVAARLGGRGGDGLWETFVDLLGDALSDATRARATGRPVIAPGLGAAAPGALVALRDEALLLLRRGDAVNVDRLQMLAGVARLMRETAREATR